MSVERDGSEIVQVRELLGNVMEMPRWYFEAHRLPSWRIVKQIELTELDTPARNLPNGIWLHVLDVLRFYGLAPAPASVLMAVAKLIDETLIEDGGRLRPDGTVDRDLDLKDDRDDAGRPLTVAADAARPKPPWVVRAAWCTSSPTYYGPFASADAANAWAKRRLDGDIACIGYEVEHLLGEGDAPSSILEAFAESSAGAVD